MANFFPQRFSDPALETAFHRHWLKESLTQIRLGYVLGLAMVFAFAGLDSVYFDDAIAQRMQWFRYGLVAPFCAVMLAYSFSSLAGPWIFLVSAVSVTVTTLMYSLVAQGYSTVNLSFIFPSFVQFALLFYVLFRMPFRLAVIGGLLQLATVVYGISNMEGNPYHISSAIGGVVAVHAILLVASLRQEFQERALFRNELELSSSIAARERVYAERTRWYPNLARFLRHELSNQLAGVRTSLELIGRFPARQSDYLQRAQSSIDRMQIMLDETSRASSIEQALETEEKELIDLSALLGDCVQGYRDTYAGQTFEARIRPGVMLLAQPYRVVQLLDNLVGNAVRHSDGASPVEIHLAVAATAEADELVLRVMNQGDPLPADPDRLFSLWATEALDSDPTRHGLGLFVAARIVESLGGRIFAEPYPLAANPGARNAGVAPPLGRSVAASTEPNTGAAFVVYFPAETQSLSSQE